MKRLPAVPHARGFTLIELLIVLAISAVVLVLAAPSFRSLLDTQRLRGVSNQFSTDLQFARTEAASRQEVVNITFKGLANNSQLTCYTIATCGTVDAADCTCDCTLAAGSRCVAPQREIRTVQLAKSGRIALASVKLTGATYTANRISIDPATGGMKAYFLPLINLTIPPPTSEFWVQAAIVGTPVTAGNWATTWPALQTQVSGLGRPSVCSPGGKISGPPSC
jgi:prepilin-type N-terminal cleavage/methylation domain-containing protein